MVRPGHPVRGKCHHCDGLASTRTSRKAGAETAGFQECKELDIRQDLTRGEVDLVDAMRGYMTRKGRKGVLL